MASFVQVDGQPLQGFSNHDAVEVLRNTGQVVNLKLARYQHGAKFDMLQQYLGKPGLKGFTFIKKHNKGQ